MRPRKKILLIDKNEYRKSVLAFVLGVYGYDVVKASEPERRWDCDLVIVRAIQATDAKLAFPHRPVMSIGRCGMADGFIHTKAPMCEVIELVRVMLARKRGPRRPGSEWEWLRNRAAA